MQTTTNIMRSLAKLIFKYYKAIVIVSFMLAIGGVYLITTNIEIKTNIKDLLPDSKKTKAFNNIIDNFQSASSVFMLIEGDEKHTVPFARFITNKINQNEKLSKYVKNIKLEQNKDFIKKYALLIAKNNTTDNSVSLFENLNLLPFFKAYNDNMEKTYTGKYKQETIDSNREEIAIERSLAGLELFIKSITDYLKNPESMSINKRAYKMAELMTIGEIMEFSPDRKMLLVSISPTISINDYEEGNEFIFALDDFIKRHSKDHPNIVVRLGGTFALQKDEYIYLMRDMKIPALIAVILIIILFLVSFRAPRATIFVILSLIVAICWTAGLIAIISGQMNAMTNMFGIILLGLGVDFGIHIITQYTEDRANGLNKQTSLENSFTKVGMGVIVGGLTTAIAFYTLGLSNAKVMNEFGIVIGSGIVLCLISMITFLPSIMVWLDKKDTAYSKSRIYLKYSFLENTGKLIIRYNKIIIVLFVAVTLVMAYFANKTSFQYDMLEIEPENADSVIAHRKIMKKFNMSPDYVTIALKDDTDKDIKGLKYKDKLSAIEKAKRITDVLNPKIDMIAFVDSIHHYVPSQKRQLINLKHLKRLRSQSGRTKPINITSNNLGSLINEINRLRDNILELSDMTSITFGDDSRVMKKRNIMIKGNKDIFKALIGLINSNRERNIRLLNNLSMAFANEMDKAVMLLASPKEVLRLDDLPSDIKKQYISKDGKYILCSIYINKNVLDQRILESTRDLFDDIKIRHLKPEDDSIVELVDEPKDKAIKIIPKANIDLKGDSDFVLSDDFKVDVQKEEESQKAIKNKIVSAEALLEKDVNEYHDFTGMPMIMLEVIDMFSKEGYRSVLLALTVIIILLMLYTRSIKYTILGIIPLVFGFIWMMGIMHILGFKIDFFNIMVLPIILGIGIDDGVHIIHRFRVEGDDNPVLVLRYTGRSIFLTSMTNIFAFGTIAILGSYKGFQGFAASLSYGVIGFFLTSLLLLTSLIYVFRKTKEN